LSEALAVRLLLGLALVLFVVLRLPCAAIPLERDEGAYAYVAQRILAGATPYRDVFDHKPPLVYLAYILPVGLFGTSVVAIHVAGYAASALAAVLLFWCLRRLLGALAAACAVAVFVVLTIEPRWLATAANTEQFMLPALLGCFACLLVAERSSGALAWVASGALAAAACWIKPVAATDALFLAGFVLFRLRRNAVGPFPVSAGRVFGLAAAGAAAVCLSLAGALAVRGSWPAFTDAVLSYNIDYVSDVTLSAGLERLKSSIASQTGSLWAIGLVAGVAMLDIRRGRRAVAAALLGALASAAAGISIGLHFRGHYFLQAAPVLATAAGLAMSRAITRLGGASGGGRALAVTLLLPAAVLAPGLAHDARFFFQYSPDEKVRALYAANPFDVSASFASRLDATTRADDTVLVYGSEPQILFLARRVSATRYIEFYPLTLPGQTAERRQREAWADITRSSPQAILITGVGASLFASARSPTVLREKVDQLLAAGFTLEGLRVFDTGSGRMLFGAAAREFALEKERTGRAPPTDMYLFVRSRAPGT
jgi:hypothetical protein